MDTERILETKRRRARESNKRRYHADPTYKQYCLEQGRKQCARYHDDPRARLRTCAKQRAAKRNVSFDLTVEDIVIPDFCPVLGIALKTSRGRGVGSVSPNSPTLDRIIPEFGYTRSNVVVISHRANTLKNNASPEELTRVAQWLRTVYPQWLLID